MREISSPYCLVEDTRKKDLKNECQRKPFQTSSKRTDTDSQPRLCSSRRSSFVGKGLFPRLYSRSKQHYLYCYRHCSWVERSASLPYPSVARCTHGSSPVIIRFLPKHQKVSGPERKDLLTNSSCTVFLDPETSISSAISTPSTPSNPLALHSEDKTAFPRYRDSSPTGRAIPRLTCPKPPPTAITASTLAPLLFRASSPDGHSHLHPSLMQHAREHQHEHQRERIHEHSHEHHRDRDGDHDYKRLPNHDAQALPQRISLPAIDPISRPSSTSTQPSNLHHGASLPQLPGLSALANLASTSHSPQLRAFGGNGHSNMTQTYGASPTPTTVGGSLGNSPPTCQNCTTSTTPLWRRDEIGSVLCNACGLFLKLHGRARPISLKTDVIKSRNRVKSSGNGQGQKKKSLFEANGLADSRSQQGTPPPGSLGHQRTSQKSHNGGGSDGSNSPISRTGTPSMYPNHLQPFDGNSMSDHPFHSPSLAPLHLRAPSPGRSESSMNGDRHLDIPQTYEQLIAANSSLKTRVSELEVINELFRGRVTQLEQDEANARRGEEMRRESEHSLRLHLEESQRRENQLKRRLDDLEREVQEMRDATGHRAKKMRVADMVGDSEGSTPQSVTS